MGPWIVSSCNPCQIIQTTLVNHMTVAMQSTPLPFGFFVQECRLAKWFDFGFNVFWRLCFQFECVLLCASCLTQVCLHVKQVCSWGLGRGTACSRQRQWVQDVSWAIPACIGTIPHCNQSWILWRRHLDCSFYFFALFRFTCFLSSDMSVLLFLCRTCGWRSPTGMTSEALRRPPKKQPMNLIDRKLHLRHLSCWNSEDFSSNRTGMDGW